MGILVAGASVGGIIFPMLLHRLIPKIGFGMSPRNPPFFFSPLRSDNVPRLH